MDETLSLDELAHLLDQGVCGTCGCPMRCHDERGCWLHKRCKQVPASTEDLEEDTDAVAG